MDKFNKNKYDSYLDVFKLLVNSYKDSDFVKKHEKFSKVLLIVGLPIWITVILLITSLILFFYVALWATVTIFVIVFLAIYIFSLLSIIFGLMRIVDYGFFYGLFGIGLGLFAAGISLVLINPIVKILKKLYHSIGIPVEKMTIFFAKE